MATKTATTKSVEKRLAAALAELAGLRNAAKRNSRRYYYANREQCLAKRREYLERKRDYLRERVVCPLCGRTAQRQSLRSHQRSKRCKRAHDLKNGDVVIHNEGDESHYAIEKAKQPCHPVQVDVS